MSCLPYNPRMTRPLSIPIWAGPDGLRLWRSARGDFYGDEVLDARTVYPGDTLRAIAADGFNAVWLRGRLAELATSPRLPELNDSGAPRRMDALRDLIERASRHRLSVYLFFNEPLAPPPGHAVFRAHPELRGEPFVQPVSEEPLQSLCASHPRVAEWFAEAVGQVLDGLPGLGGVVLITASEHHTHCWSHHARFGLDDGYVFPAEEPLACPRCRDREPADIVADLVGAWTNAASRQARPPRVLAWNWRWSMWYRDPQREVIDRLPERAELLADFERGGRARRAGREVAIDEYSLGYVGPSERFAATREAARARAMPVHAKLQLGTTHELATVPNLPLIPNLVRKLRGMTREKLSGFMGCWNFGATPTLNTFAVRMAVERPEGLDDVDGFCRDVARGRFGGGVDADAVVAAWGLFCEAFGRYPFGIRFLYVSPVNYAPALPLTSHYRGAPLGPAWREHTWGDRLEDCLGPFSLAETVAAFEAMARIWAGGLTIYESALGDGGERHRVEELSCARMVGCHLEACVEAFAFHRERLERIERLGLEPPCNVPLTAPMRESIGRHLATARRALGLVEADERLGIHQEAQSRFVSPERLRRAIAAMEGERDG